MPAINERSLTRRCTARAWRREAAAAAAAGSASGEAERRRRHRRRRRLWRHRRGWRMRDCGSCRREVHAGGVGAAAYGLHPGGEAQAGTVRAAAGVRERLWSGGVERARREGTPRRSPGDATLQRKIGLGPFRVSCAHSTPSGPGSGAPTYWPRFMATIVRNLRCARTDGVDRGAERVCARDFPCARSACFPLPTP